MNKFKNKISEFLLLGDLSRPKMKMFYDTDLASTRSCCWLWELPPWAWSSQLGMEGPRGHQDKSDLQRIKKKKNPNILGSSGSTCLKMFLPFVKLSWQRKCKHLTQNDVFKFKTSSEISGWISFISMVRVNCSPFLLQFFCSLQDHGD